MTATHIRPAVLALAATLATTGCLCGADEERAVTISAPDSLAVARDGETRRVGSVSRLTEFDGDPSAFQYVFATIEGATTGEGVVLSLSGMDTASNEIVIVALALPVSLRRGEEYPVGATFNVDPGLTPDPRLSGAYDLQQPNQAEAALTIATYSFPPPQYTVGFRAVTASGTVRVTERERGRVELSLNLSFADAAGRTVGLTGRAQANTERYTPPCT